MHTEKKNPFTPEDFANLDWQEVGYTAVLDDLTLDRKKHAVGDWSNLENVKLGVNHFGGHSFPNIVPRIQSDYVRAKSEVEQRKGRRKRAFLIGAPLILAASFAAVKLIPDSMMTASVYGLSLKPLITSGIGGMAGGFFSSLLPSMREANKNLEESVSYTLKRVKRFEDEKLSRDVDAYHDLTKDFKEANKRLVRKVIYSGGAIAIAVAPLLGAAFIGAGVVIKKLKEKRQEVQKEKAFKSILYDASIKSLGYHVKHNSL